MHLSGSLLKTLGHHRYHRFACGNRSIERARWATLETNPSRERPAKSDPQKNELRAKTETGRRKGGKKHTKREIERKICGRKKKEKKNTRDSCESWQSVRNGKETKKKKERKKETTKKNGDQRCFDYRSSSLDAKTNLSTQ